MTAIAGNWGLFLVAGLLLFVVAALWSAWAGRLLQTEEGVRGGTPGAGPGGPGTTVLLAAPPVTAPAPAPFGRGVVETAPPFAPPSAPGAPPAQPAPPPAPGAPPAQPAPFGRGSLETAPPF